MKYYQQQKTRTTKATYWYRQQHAWTSQTLCEAKESRPQSVHILSLFIWNSKQIKLTHADRNQNRVCLLGKFALQERGNPFSKLTQPLRRLLRKVWTQEEMSYKPRCNALVEGSAEVVIPALCHWTLRPRGGRDNPRVIQSIRVRNQALRCLVWCFTHSAAPLLSPEAGLALTSSWIEPVPQIYFPPTCPRYLALWEN